MPDWIGVSLVLAVVIGALAWAWYCLGEGRWGPWD